jgi:hypothetical protein
VIDLDVDDATSTALAIALNRTGELAAWDEPALHRILASLQDEFPSDVLGFDQAALDELIASVEPIEVEQDEVPARVSACLAGGTLPQRAGPRCDGAFRAARVSRAENKH